MHSETDFSRGPCGCPYHPYYNPPMQIVERHIRLRRGSVIPSSQLSNILVRVITVILISEELNIEYVAMNTFLIFLIKTNRFCLRSSLKYICSCQIYTELNKTVCSKHPLVVNKGSQDLIIYLYDANLLRLVFHLLVLNTGLLE